MGLRRNVASDRNTAQNADELQPITCTSAGTHFSGKQAMTIRPLLLSLILFLVPRCTLGQQTEPVVPRTINLHQAVELALQHNHHARIASLHLADEQHTRKVPEAA